MCVHVYLGSVYPGTGQGIAEGGMALQTTPVEFRRPSEPRPDLSLLNPPLVLLHCVVSPGAGRWTSHQRPYTLTV